MRRSAGAPTVQRLEPAPLATREQQNPCTMSLFASFANDDDASGSLWGNDASAGGLFSNPLQDLLDSGNFTLNDVLTQQTLIQEVRNLNESLVKYLKENVTSLVEIVVNEESAYAASDENTNSQETNVDPAVLAASASEIFACDVSEINDELATEQNLNILFSVLTGNTPSARAAGNFYKCMLSICKDSDERRASLLSYLAARQGDLLESFVAHMSVDSIAASFRLLLEASDLKPTSIEPEGAPQGDDTTASFPKPFWPADDIVVSLIRTLHDADKPQTAFTNVAETLIDSIARSTYTPPPSTSFAFGDSGGMDLNQIAQQQQQEQRQRIEQTPMMSALTSHISQVLDALPNRGAFFIVTRLLEECGIIMQQRQEGDGDAERVVENASGKCIPLDIDAVVGAVEAKANDFVAMIVTPNTRDSKMSTNMKSYKPFGIEGLLAVELVSMLASIKPNSVDDATCDQIFDLMETYPLHNILHSAVSRMIIERGVKTDHVVDKVMAFFSQAKTDVSLEVAYGGHYLEIAKVLGVESTGITEASKVWDTELGNMVLPSSLGNGSASIPPTQSTGVLEYEMGEDDEDSDDSDDDDDDDEVDDEILRQRYGWGGDDADSSNAGTTGANTSGSSGNDDIKFDAFSNNSDNVDKTTTDEDVSFDAFGVGNANNGTAEQEMSFATFGSSSNGGAGDDDDEVKFE